MIVYSGSFGGVWEELLEMAQGYCNRLVEEAKNHYYILGGRLYQDGENQHFI